MRKLRRAQSEVLGALAMAVLLALAVGAYSRIAQLQSATASELASLASTVGELLGESVLLSVRGDRVLASPNMDSRAVYRAVVAGGEVLWENSTAVELPAGQWSEVYRGQYSELVESCEATVVLVTDRGRLYSWCPTVAGSGGPSGLRLLAELGYKVAFAFVYNVWDLMSRGPVHARTASGGPTDLRIRGGAEGHRRGAGLLPASRGRDTDLRKRHPGNCYRGAGGAKLGSVP